MAVRFPDSTERGRRRVRRPVGPALSTAIQYSLRKRVLVIAPDLVAVVRCTGGWLFDLVMGGWDVCVHTADHADPRPLRILGACADDLETVLAGQPRGWGLQVIAVQADLYSSDWRIQQLVRQARSACLTEVRLWGDDPPAGAAGPVSHQLSLAARAFKAHALAAAAAAPADVSQETEVFWRAAA